MLATPATRGRLLEALRDAGYAPVPEDATGAAVLTRPKARRAPARHSFGYRRVADPMAALRLTTPRLAGDRRADPARRRGAAGGPAGAR